KLTDPKVDLKTKQELINKFQSAGTRKNLTKLIDRLSKAGVEKKESEAEARSLESREKELSTKLRESKRAGAPKEVLDKLENDLKETTNEKRSAQNVMRRASSEIKTIKEVELNKEITSKDAVEIFKHMTPVEQLDYVKDFLMPFKGRMNSLEDAYMAVL